MASQLRVWAPTSGTVTRQHKSTNAKSGCGNSRRLYVGRIGNYDYTSYLKFEFDTSQMGKLVKAVLVLYTDDGLGDNDLTLSDTPAIRIRRATDAFSEGNNSDGDFDSSDYTTSATTSAGEKKTVMTEEANGINRIDITAIVDSWMPAHIKRSNGKTGAPAKNYGLVLQPYTGAEADTKREWSGWSEDAADSSVRPFIEVTYEYGATTPDVPTDLSPTGTVDSIGSFEGDFTDIRSTDKLARSQVQVYSPAHSATIAVDNTVTDAGHGLANGAVIYFTSLTGGAGLSTFTAYYVVQRTTNTFKVSTTKGGSPVNVTDDYSAATWRTKVYDRTQAESNTAIVAGRFDHIPSDLHLARNTAYSWRARVYDNEGQASAWSSLQSVTVTNTDPNAPTLSPTGKTYSTLDGIAFKGGTFSDPDAGNTLLAYQVQLSSYAEGAPEWDDGTFLLWDTGKRLVGAGATSWATPYGGISLDAGTYHWRARQWDNHQGLSSWAYGTVTLSADFETEPEDSVNSIQFRPRAPWRILIKDMKYNAVGGALTGSAASNVLTTATNHGLRPGRRVKFASLSGGSGLFTKTVYYVKTVPTSKTLTVSETAGGSTVDFTTNVTSGSLTAITTRGPGDVVAALEDATNVGASLVYNSPGELHFTLGISHPQLSVIEPRQTHYAVEFRQGDGWREVFAGLMMDFDATDTDVVFYGTDYLGLLDFTVDEKYDPANIEKSSDNGGSKYVNKTITAVVTDQLKRAREPVNSIVGFISTGSIATMDEQITVYSTYQPTLPFISSLLDSHRSGTGKRTRLMVKKNGSSYQFVVVDDPGVVRDNLRLRYGELVQGYRIVPFGSDWATRVNAIGRDKNGIKVRYSSAVATGIDENVWGRWMKPVFLDGVADANDMTRRTKQAVQSSSKLGKNVALALRSGVLQPRDGYDLCDQFHVDIEHGSVSTDAFGSGYWVAVGITWTASGKGDLNTTLTLHPREDTVAPDDDLLSVQPVSEQNEWQIGWHPPKPITATNAATSRYWLDQNTGIVYERQQGNILATGATGTI